MTLETATDQNEMNETSTTPQFPVTGWWRVWYGLFIIVLPAFSFWAIEIFKPEWQSGDLQAYLALLLSAKTSLLFLFLLAYSIICYILLLTNPHRIAESFLIRFGVYGGVVLALQYSIFLLLYLFDNVFSYAIVFVWLFPLYFPRFYRWAVRRWNARMVGYLLAILIVTAFVIAISTTREFLFFVIVALVIAGPFWCFLMAVQATLWLLKNYESKFTLPRGLSVTAWLAVYAAAWRYDILKMYELYSQLPTVPPDCYIATAAAQGHSKFVGSQTIQLAGGKIMRVNHQLQIFKCAELALMAVAPQLHKIMRRIYDLIGKPLARKIQHPFLADVAYLLLKPFEEVARFVLKITIPEIDSRLKEVYPKL